MASKFMNTSHKVNVSVDNLVEGFKKKLKNPYYIHMDSQPALTTYYNQDIRTSTLDEGSKTEYTGIGKDSPLRFNKINNFYVYGLEKIATELDYGDWGLESSSIEGECIILPNTIVPIPNDFFIINHADKKLLFKVTNVSVNTIENGSNFYKINYKLDQVDSDKIEAQVNDTFEMIVTNVGTQFKTIIKTSDYHHIDHVECILDRLKTYYRDLFYSTRVQTFIFMIDEDRFYDPYMIEFIKKHQLMKNGNDYLYVAHQTVVPATFSLDYDKTFFRLIEHPRKLNPEKKPLFCSQATLIEEYLSILSTRAEDYYKINYIRENNANPNMYIIENFKKDLIDRIYDNNKYKDNNYLNIIIKYLNNEKITVEDVYTIEDIDFEKEMSLFYNIPILIYILEANIKSILVTNK